MTQKTRLERLEKVSGGEHGVAVTYEHEDFVTISQPVERRGEQVSREDFERLFPDGTLIQIKYVETPTPPRTD